MGSMLQLLDRLCYAIASVTDVCIQYSYAIASIADICIQCSYAIASITSTTTASSTNVLIKTNIHTSGTSEASSFGVGVGYQCLLRLYQYCYPIYIGGKIPLITIINSNWFGWCNYIRCVHLTSSLFSRTNVLPYLRVN